VTYPTPRKFHATAIPAAVLVAIVSTWPVAAHLRDHVIDGAALIDPRQPENPWAGAIGADVLTTVWILNWVLHALMTQPFHLFDANIFYPTPLAGARQEILFATDLLGIPGAIVCGPICAHQTALLLCLAATAWSTAYVVARWTASVVGGVVAGVLFATSAFHQYQLFHLQSLGTVYFPLLLLGLERLGATGAPRWAALVAGAMVLQTLSGQYLGYMALVAAAIGAVVCLPAGRSEPPLPRRLASDVAYLAAAGIVAAVVLLPFLLPYVRLRGTGDIPDNRIDLLHSVVGLWAYLPNRWDFPGIPWATWGLAIVGLVASVRAPDRAARVRATMLVAIGALGAWISLGPYPGGGVPTRDVVERGVWRAPGEPGWTLWWQLGTLVPGFASMREPVRFALLPCLAAAMLGGIGAAALARRLTVIGVAVAVTLTVLAFGGAWRGPLPLRRVPVGDEVPAVYRALARCGDGDPLVELPMGTGWDDWRDAEPQLFSVYHWLPLLNGRVSYVPPTLGNIRRIANKDLPAPAAVAELRRSTGVRWVLVHCEGWGIGFPSVARLCADDPWPGRPAHVFTTTRLFDLGRVPVLPRPLPHRPEPSRNCLDGTASP
jgi:hypothetical protein